MALCADAEVRDGTLVGDPTEGALVVLAAKGGIDPQETRDAIPRVAVLPFDAAYKFMATFHRVKDESGRDVIRAFVKGAPDQLLSRAKDALAADGRLVPAAEMTERFNAENERLAKNGLRVMCAARRDFDPASFDPNADLLPLVSDLTLLALAGIVDPPRPEARHGDRRGARRRHPGQDDHRRPRGDRRGHRQRPGHPGRGDHRGGVGRLQR